ncbi:MAG: hypothetical protein ABIQ60_13790 [Burkholderiaceae bacterium]
MSSLKYFPIGGVASHRPAFEWARRAIAIALRRVSAALVRLSRRMVRHSAQVVSQDARLEFYAEAGAPEGALYLDGRLVGQIRGVKRL